MTTFAHTRRLSIIPLAIAACLLLAIPAAAIPMKVTAGFDGALKSRIWTPVAVELTNDTPTQVEGVLTMRHEANADPFLALCSANVVLPPHSHKLYHLYVKLPDYAGRTMVVLARRGGILAMKQLTLSPSAQEDLVVVTAGSRAARLNFLSGETVQISGASRGMSTLQATVKVGSIDPRLLPERPSGYDGADVLVLSDFSPESASKAALDSLAMWVASGRTLVVAGTPNYKLLTHPFYRDLLPVTVKGVEVLQGMSALGPGMPAGPVYVAKSTVKPIVGEHVLDQGGTPIIAQRQYGAGRVIFMAFDYASSPIRDWNGQVDMWKKIALAAPEVPIVGSMEGSVSFSGRPAYYHPGPAGGRTLRTAIEHNAQIEAPSFNTIAIFLLAYLVCLVPVNYLVLHRKRRLELAWVTTPAIILLFTVGAYAIGFSMKGGGLELIEATVLETSSGSRFASSITDASLFSPARRTYDLSAEGEFQTPQTIGDDAEREIILDEQSQINGVAVPMWATGQFESKGGVDLGGAIDADVKIKGGVVTGTITNNTRFDLTDCDIQMGPYSQPVPNIPRGKTVTVSAARPMRGGLSYASSFPREMPITERLPVVVRALASGTTPAPVLLARPMGMKAVFGVSNNRADIRSATVIACRLDMPAPPAPQAAAVAPGAQGSAPTGRRVLSSTIAVESQHGNVVYARDTGGLLDLKFNGPGKVVSTFQAPNVAGLGIHVPASSASPGSIINLSVFSNRLGDWVDVGSAPGMHPLPGPASDYAVNGKIRTKVKIDGPQGNDAIIMMTVQRTR